MLTDRDLNVYVSTTLGLLQHNGNKIEKVEIETQVFSCVQMRRSAEGVDQGYQDIFMFGMLAIVGAQQLSTFVPAFKLTVCSLLVWMYSPSRSFLLYQLVSEEMIWWSGIGRYGQFVCGGL
jgi:hypothetical protein